MKVSKRYLLYLVYANHFLNFIDFVNMLNEMRFGQLSQQSILKFKSLSREIRYDDGMGPTELYVVNQFFG